MSRGKERIVSRIFLATYGHIARTEIKEFVFVERTFYSAFTAMVYLQYVSDVVSFHHAVLRVHVVVYQVNSVKYAIRRHNNVPVAFFYSVNRFVDVA